MKRSIIQKCFLAILLTGSIAGCTTKETAEKTNTAAGKTTVNETQRKTNKDGSVEVTLKDGSSITFASGTSESEIQDAIKAMESGVQQSQGSLTGGDDTDQSEDIQASEADSIETFE